MAEKQEDWTNNIFVRIGAAIIGIGAGILVLQSIFNIIPISSDDTKSLEQGLKISLMLNGIILIAVMYTIMEMKRK